MPLLGLGEQLGLLPANHRSDELHARLTALPCNAIDDLRIIAGAGDHKPKIQQCDCRHIEGGVQPLRLANRNIEMNRR